MKRDLELINVIFTNQSILVADIELIYKCIQKYYYFTSEYHLKKKLPVSSTQVASTFCFTSKYKAENYIQKPHLYQGHHVFDQAIASIQSDQLISSIGVLPQVKMVQLIPSYRKKAPLGSSVFLDAEEFRNVDRDRIPKEQCYNRHVEKLKKKKPELYDIKTPIPANPNRCFVCEDQITDDYKGHLKSEQHMNCIKNQPLYDEIDALIDQMNEDLILDEKQKKKRGRKKGLKQVQGEGLTLDDIEASHLFNNGDNMGNTQELTNINFMSTEVTIAAKEVHKRKQKIPIHHCQEIIQLDRNTIEQKRLMQIRNMQMQQSFIQPIVIQKRKRVQIIEEEKEDVKSNSNNNGNLEFLAFNDERNIRNTQQIPIDRVYYQAPRKYLTKTRKQLKDQQQIQSVNQIENFQQVPQPDNQ